MCQGSSLRAMSSLDRLCLAITGQNSIVVYHQLQAIYFNLVTWFLVLIGWRKPTLRLSTTDLGNGHAIIVLSPGGYERLRLAPFATEDVVTVGYNVTGVDRLPFSNSLCLLSGGVVPAGHVVVSITSFSINCNARRTRASQAGILI